MRSVYKTLMIIGLIGFFITTACKNTDYDSIPMTNLMGDSLTTTYTIEQLENEFMINNDRYSDYPKIAGLFFADSIKSAADVVISGVITSTDVEGNVYKAIYVQEKKTDGRAIKVQLDISGISSLYNIGQRVWIRCNGLFIGKYGEAAQIGSYYVDYSKFKINTSTKDTVYRISPGRMSYYSAKTNIHTYGLPDMSLIKVDTMTIAQIKTFTNNNVNKILNKIICIKNAYFTGKGDGDMLTDVNLIFAPSTNGVGYPQLRDISDNTGTISIATSEYAKFANYKIPSSKYVGNITVLVGWYRNYVDKTGTWQLTMRSINDLGTGFEGYIKNLNK